MTVIIGRRELLAALGGAVAAWPLAANAQQSAMPQAGSLVAGRSTVSQIVCDGKTGLPRIRYHELRHAHATHLLSSDVHPKVASERGPVTAAVLSCSGPYFGVRWQSRWQLVRAPEGLHTRGES